MKMICICTLFGQTTYVHFGPHDCVQCLTHSHSLFSFCLSNSSFSCSHNAPGGINQPQLLTVVAAARTAQWNHPWLRDTILWQGRVGWWMTLCLCSCAVFFLSPWSQPGIHSIHDEVDVQHVGVVCYPRFQKSSYYWVSQWFHSLHTAAVDEWIKGPVSDWWIFSPTDVFIHVKVNFGFGWTGIGYGLTAFSAL